MSLYRLIYASRASEQMKPDDLAQILASSQRNNQRVHVAVVAGHAGGTLRVARGSFVDDGGASLFVVQGGKAVRRPARLGLLGYDAVEIVETAGGPREGDEVILSDLKEYAGVDQLRLN